MTDARLVRRDGCPSCGVHLDGTEDHGPLCGTTDVGRCPRGCMAWLCGGVCPICGHGADDDNRGA